jgi:hypothetical protein
VTTPTALAMHAPAAKIQTTQTTKFPTYERAL